MVVEGITAWHQLIAAGIVDEELQEFNAYESGENNPVLALIGNYVRNAEHRGANPQPTSRARLLLLNSTATAVATTGFSTENLDD